MAKAAPTKKETTEPVKVSPDLFIGIKNKNATSAGGGNNPETSGNVPFPQQTPEFGMPPFSAHMQGIPQAPMPPIAPGSFLGRQQVQGNISVSLRNMVYLGIETINSALAGSTQIIQSITGTGYHAPYHHHGRENDCYHSASCCGHHHQNYEDNCCSTQDCNSSVHGCGQ